MKCNRWDFPFITENIVAMVRVTQPTNEEIGYSSYCYVPLSISEEADYHYDGITGTLLYGGVPIKEY